MDDAAWAQPCASEEVVLLTRKAIPMILPMYVGSKLVTTRPTAKYLGVTLDSKLCFWPHIKQVNVERRRPMDIQEKTYHGDDHLYTRLRSRDLD